MNALHVTAAVIDALAWPAAEVVIATLLRRPLTAALSGQVKRWKAGSGGVEVEYWEHTLAQARQPLADLAHRHRRITDEALNAMQGLACYATSPPTPTPTATTSTPPALDYLHLADAVLKALRNQPRRDGQWSTRKPVSATRPRCVPPHGHASPPGPAAQARGQCRGSNGPPA